MKKLLAGMLFAAVAVQGAVAAEAEKLRVMYDTAIGGFTFPESVAYDSAAKVLYVSNFGGSELKPGEKDGMGRIAKVGLDGKIIDSRFLPDTGDVLNKPKGLWVRGGRLWVTDIDAVWEFDLKTQKGRRVALPDAKFANDPAILGNALYVSDSRADQVFKVEPADFLDAKQAPRVSKLFSGKGVDPNGLYPGKDGSLLIAGFKSDKEARAIVAVNAKGDVKTLSKPIGRLDGLYQMKDGTILATDWNTGSLFRWSEAGGVETLASNFKGPADFCVVPQANGYLVVVPDLVKSELRLIRLVRQ